MKILKDKLSKNRVDSFWYHNEEIAVIERKKGAKLVAETRGEIEMFFEENGTKFKGDNAVIEALNRNFTDKNLNEMLMTDLFIFNNWFVVVEIDCNGNYSDDLAICGNYDEVIKLLKEIDGQM